MMVKGRDEEPEFLRRYYFYDNICFSEKNIETFLAFYRKSLYYEDIGGYLKRVPDKVFENILQRWDVLPDELKERATLQAIAKYADKSEYTAYGAFIPKEFGRAQINYNRDYFSSVEEYERVCTELDSLPNDKRVVYDYIHDHSMFNLNYVPNKIRLLDDYVSDKINISFQEKTLWLNNKHIKYEDLVEFGNLQRNFSHNNYLKSVDLLMSVLANDKDGAVRFRKMYQYYNLSDAVQVEDYNEYNYRQYIGDDDTYNEDESDDFQEISNDVIDDFEQRHNFDLDISSSDNDLPIIALYLQNQEEVSKTAYAMCRTFGKRSGEFIKRFLEVADADFEGEKICYDNDIDVEKEKRVTDLVLPMDEFEEDLNFLSEKDGMIKKRINAARLRNFSFNNIIQEQKKILADSFSDCEHVYFKEELCSQMAQEQLLSLLSLLPRDFTEEKYLSLGNFMEKHFFYRTGGGKIATRPLDEIKKIIKIWPQLTNDQEQMKYSAVLALSKADGYLNSQKEEFVTEAKLRNLPRSLFDIAQSAYIRGLDAPRTIAEDYSVKDGQYTLRLMDIKDPSIMFIGEGFSCQTISKAGIYPALSSVQDPFSRALVVEKGNDVVGLAWVWTTEEEKYGKRYKSVCIDNLELADFVCDRNELCHIMSGLQSLSIRIADEGNFRRVTLGAKARHYMPENYFSSTDALNLPDAYINQTPIKGIEEKINYGDSANQVLVYENHLAEPLKKEIEVFVAHRDIYTITEDEENEALAVGDKAYPWKAEFREKNKDSQFMILKDKQNRVLGYALYSDTAHHVHDVAVDPEYQVYSKYMLFELLNHMKAHADKPWEAECRKSTSLALLEKMAERGSIHLVKQDGVMGIMGERLQKVSIDFNVTTSQDKPLSNYHGRAYKLTKT